MCLRFGRLAEPASAAGQALASSNPNHHGASNPMVEAAQVYHPKILRAIDALARCYARQEVKQQIRARNQRVTDYDPRDILIMARALLHSRAEHFLERAKASTVVKEVEAKIAAQAARKAAVQKSACSRHFHRS